MADDDARGGAWTVRRIPLKCHPADRESGPSPAEETSDHEIPAGAGRRTLCIPDWNARDGAEQSAVQGRASHRALLHQDQARSIRKLHEVSRRSVQVAPRSRKEGWTDCRLCGLRHHGALAVGARSHSRRHVPEHGGTRQERRIRGARRKGRRRRGDAEQGDGRSRRDARGAGEPDHPRAGVEVTGVSELPAIASEPPRSPRTKSQRSTTLENPRRMKNAGSIPAIFICLVSRTAFCIVILPLARGGALASPGNSSAPTDQTPRSWYCRSAVSIRRCGRWPPRCTAV